MLHSPALRAVFSFLAVLTLMPWVTSGAGRIAQQPGASEVVGLRTLNAKVFQRADGSGYVQVFSYPVHYQDGFGGWAEIRPELIQLAGANTWANTAGDVAVQFQATSEVRTNVQSNLPATPLVSLATATRSVTFEPVGAQSVAAQVSGARITYPEIYNGVDLQYLNASDAVKENLIFHRLPDQTAFTFVLRVLGAVPQLEANGGITLDPCGETCWSILPPYMEDASGATTDAVTTTLERVGDGTYALTYTPDAAWLTNTKRVYPVVLDPTVDTRGGGDTLYTQQGYPTIAGYQMRYLSLGYDPEINGKMITRAFFYAAMPQIPAGSTIDSAVLNMYQYYAPNTTGYNTVVYNVTTAWQTSPVSYPWNNSPSVDATVITSANVSSGLGWKTWDVTNLARQWYSGVPNNGVAIYANPESARGAYFCSSHASGTVCGLTDALQLRPYFVVNYTVPGPVTYSIAGRVSDSANVPLAGVQVTDGASHSATTAADGSYTFSGLPPGSYTLTPTKSGYSFSPASRSVSLSGDLTGQDFTATPLPALQVAPTNLSFSAPQGGASPAAQTLSISNGGGGTLSWSASESLTWLNLSSTSGTAPASVSVTANTSGLSAGTYTDTITLSASGASGSPQTISVTVTVNLPTSTADAYEPDDTCAQAQPIPPDGTVQNHTFHVAADQDWVRLDAIAGTTYQIHAFETGRIANPTLELFDQCGGPPQVFDGNIFGHDVQMPLDAPTTGAYYLRVTNRDPVQHGAEATYRLSLSIDATLPAPPRDVQARAGNASISLQWRPNGEPDVTGYRLRYGTRPGTYDRSVDITGRDAAVYLLTNLTNDTRYYLELVALDFGGHASGPSAEVNADPSLSADTTIPTISITDPTTANIYLTTQTSVLVQGVSADSGGNLSHVHVINAANGEQSWDYAPAGGSSPWMIGGLPLELGDNNLVATIYDSAGNMSTARITITRVEGRGVAIIVAGQREDGDSQILIANIANRAYRIFRRAGFARNRIVYLSPNPQDADLPPDGVNDVTDTSAPANLQTALTTWAVGKVGPDVPVFLYLVDHGVEDYFCAAGCGKEGSVVSNQLWADTLNTWLGQLEQTTGARNITVIIEACHSGSFIAPTKSISGPGRVIITATSRRLSAYASATGAYFSDAFFTALERGRNLQDAFTQARAEVKASLGPMNPQEPWLDDTGNGVANEASDGALAATRTLLTVLGDQAPPPLSAQVMQHASGIWEITAQPGATDASGRTVWATIFPPSWTPPVAGYSETPSDGGTRVELTDSDGDGVYTASYPFAEVGTYRVIVASTEANGQLALPQTVSVQIGGHVFLPLVRR